VPTATETELIEIEGQTLRIRESKHPPQESRLLLLIHGFTGDENSMWVFARDLPSDYWIVAPRAPYIAEPSGYSWRPAEISDLGLTGFERLRSVAEALIRLIDTYQASVGLDAAKPVDALGFSQGAAMCSLLAFLYPDRIRKLGILAGFVPASVEPLVEQRPLAGKQVFVAHGTQDEMVPIDRARSSIKILEQAGAQVTYCEDEVGHKLSLTCLQALRKFLAD
jgi:phospholipase/carboxylesterase